MELRPEQRQAIEYARRAGTEAAAEAIRDKATRTFRELEVLLDAVPSDSAQKRPAPGKWSIHEVVDHLVVSHRRAVEQLETLIAGTSPTSGPIPAGLVSEAPFTRSWPELRAELEDVHAAFVAALARASAETSLEPKAPIEMVVRCADEDGTSQPVHWIQEFDWKAFAILFRAHTLEHYQQVRRVLAEAELP